jgi:hypothetical protein
VLRGSVSARETIYENLKDAGTQLKEVVKNAREALSIVKALA